MPQKYYMGGVCGMGMAPLAAFLKDGGAQVEGFDDRADAAVKSKLQSRCIRVDNEINPDERDFDTLVISSALSRRKAELQADFPSARILRRGECWAEICASRRLTAVVGSHGKSTVSAMISYAAQKLGLDCGYLVGAVPNGFAMHKYCNPDAIVVSEIDESDATIELFSPEVTVALNADLDHTDTYADNTALENMFERLFARTKRIVLYPSNDKMLAKIAEKSKTACVAIDVSGDFNSINRTMAHAALEATFQRLFDPSALDGYTGLLRRQEVLRDDSAIYAVADYAHHPNEVKAFVNWFLARRGDKNPLIIFQPHRYTRTRRFAEDFARIFKDAAQNGAKVAILPVYAASEPFDELGTSAQIANRANSDAISLANCGDFAKILSAFASERKGQKISVAIVGAGDFYFDAKKYLR